MGWIELPMAKMPEGDSWTVTYMIGSDDSVELVGYDVDRHMGEVIGQEAINIRAAARDLAQERPDDAEYLDEIAARLEAAL